MARGGARPARPRRRPDQQRRAARSAARSRSPTTASTTSSGRCSSTTSARCGRSSGCCRRCASALRADHQRQLDRRADEHAALLRLRRVEVGARRVLALHRLRDHRRQRQHHDDPHAAGADADDRADEDVRPLPDDHARRGRGDDLPTRSSTSRSGSRPRSGTLGQVLYAINPKSIDYILNSAYHMFPDSTAAKDGQGEGRRPRPTAPPATRGPPPTSRRTASSSRSHT